VSQPTPTASQPTPAQPRWRELLPGQVSNLRARDLDAGTDEIVYSNDGAVAEAPNWTLDGTRLVFNQDGELYALWLDDGRLELIDSGMRSMFNNDHVLDPDGAHVLATAEDGHIYRFPLSGGPARRVTDPDDGLMARYLHGVSPDGRVLAHIGGAARHDGAVYNIYLYDLDSGLTSKLSDSAKPHDGSEFSPDGQWVYFNAELNTDVPGHAQLFRVRPDGNGVEQLTDDERVNWFPHLSPDGKRLAHISFPPGTLGHPANKPVQLVVADAAARNEELRFDIFGGQGSLNVNSWAPDSRRFAYVEYPLADGS
jgi:Tol biopolymer transport system component